MYFPLLPYRRTAYLPALALIAFAGASPEGNSCEPSILNCDTRPRSLIAISASDCAAFDDALAPWAVFCAASATPPMFLVISDDPWAASLMFLAISLVVAFC